MLKGLAKFGGWRILILDLLRRAAAGSLGTYTYPVYVGVTVPIGTTIGGVALLLQIVLRKKLQSVIVRVYKVYTSTAHAPRESFLGVYMRGKRAPPREAARPGAPFSRDPRKPYILRS